MVRLLIGTYPEHGASGMGEGIWEAYLDLGSGMLSGERLLVELASPSFLARDSSGTVIAVTETVDGRLTTLSLTEDALMIRDSVSTGGAHPCHVIAADGEVWVANYTSGTFAVFSVDPVGDLVGPHHIVVPAGSGPHPDRQQGPHAHFCLVVPTTRVVWLVDLGTDRAWRCSHTPDVMGIVDDGIAVTFPPGTGPRHAVLHPSGAVFVVGELDSRLHTVSTDAMGGGTIVATQSACHTPDVGVGSFPSHIALNAAGTRLYVAVRGPDVLSTFSVTANAELTHLADTPIGGVWPRHFAVVDAPGGDLVVVANQNSSVVTVVRVDSAGVGTVVSALDLPAPACILPV